MRELVGGVSRRTGNNRADGSNCTSPKKESPSTRVYCLAKTTFEKLMDSRDEEEWAQLPQLPSHDQEEETLM
jgi:hypothetical protein